MLRIDLSAIASDELARILARVAGAIASQPKPMVAPRWTGEEVLASFDEISQAVRAALAAAAVLKDTPGWRIAGHYAIVERAGDPFGGQAFLSGGETRLTREILRSTPSGAIHVSEDFAAALHAGPAALRPRTEYVGELPGAVENPVKLYSLR